MKFHVELKSPPPTAWTVEAKDETDAIEEAHEMFMQFADEAEYEALPQPEEEHGPR